jgi:leader peptidase (prepilin peptidase)/N-methyltransferase
MPRDESVFSPPSHCPRCGLQIPWYRNLPIVTWLWQRGKCAECRAPISARYLVVELLTCIAFTACWLVFGRTEPAVAFTACVFLAILIGSTFIDFDHFIIPDQFTLGGTLLGFVLCAVAPGLQHTTSPVVAMKRSGMGIVVGAALVYAVVRLGKLLFGRERLKLPPDARITFLEDRVAFPDGELPYEEIFYRKSDTLVMEARTVELPDRCYANVPVRLSSELLLIGEEELTPADVTHMEVVTGEIVRPREAMGLGDVKFMACIGAWLGWQSTVFSLGVSSMLGAIVGVGLIAMGKREWSSRLPYGPYIAVAAVIWLFGGHRWWVAFWNR